MVKLDYELTDDGAIKLVCAICEMAVRDYKKGSASERKAIANFFKSSYFTLLTEDKIDPNAVLEYLNISDK